jgi:hypothetical protein
MIYVPSSTSIFVASIFNESRIEEKAEQIQQQRVGYSSLPGHRRLLYKAGINKSKQKVP